MTHLRRLLSLLTMAATLACRGKDTGTLHLQGRIESPLVDLAPKVFEKEDMKKYIGAP